MASAAADAFMSKAAEALETRDEFPGSAEAEATAAVAYAVLAVYAHLRNAVTYTGNANAV